MMTTGSSVSIFASASSGETYVRGSKPAASMIRPRAFRISSSSSTMRTRSEVTHPRVDQRAPTGARPSGAFTPGCLEAPQELVVGLELGELLEEPLHRLDGLEGGEGTAQLPDLPDLLGGEELLLLARARGADVDGGEHAPLGELAGEDDLHVAGPLELLEDHLVHARAGGDERGRDDGERAALLRLARGAEEPLGALEGAGVDAAGERAAGGLDLLVVGAREPGDRVEQDHDVLA